MKRLCNHVSNSHGQRPPNLEKGEIKSEQSLLLKTSDNITFVCFHRIKFSFCPLHHFFSMLPLPFRSLNPVSSFIFSFLIFFCSYNLSPLLVSFLILHTVSIYSHCIESSDLLALLAGWQKYFVRRVYESASLMVAFYNVCLTRCFSCRGRQLPCPCR